MFKPTVDAVFLYSFLLEHLCSTFSKTGALIFYFTLSCLYVSTLNMNSSSNPFLSLLFDQTFDIPLLLCHHLPDYCLCLPHLSDFPDLFHCENTLIKKPPTSEVPVKLLSLIELQTIFDTFTFLSNLQTASAFCFFSEAKLRLSFFCSYHLQPCCPLQSFRDAPAKCDVLPFSSLPFSPLNLTGLYNLVH